jgi:SAM-dependent methyltransferase
LVLFVFSLHHVPRAKLAGAIAEARRLLRPGGRLYIAEPLAQGPHQYIVELFHDETAVRAAATAALAKFAAPHFAVEHVLTYSEVRRYADFATFAARMIENMHFNGYTEAAVLAPAVRHRFAETMIEARGAFDQPVRVNLFS